MIGNPFPFHYRAILDTIAQQPDDVANMQTIVMGGVGQALSIVLNTCLRHLYDSDENLRSLSDDDQSALNEQFILAMEAPVNMYAASRIILHQDYPLPRTTPAQALDIAFAADATARTQYLDRYDVSPLLADGCETALAQCVEAVPMLLDAPFHTTNWVRRMLRLIQDRVFVVCMATYDSHA